MNALVNNEQLKKAVRSISPNVVTIKAPALQEDVRKSDLKFKEKSRLFSSEEIKKIEREILSKLRGLDRKRNLPYHNVNHTINVLKRIRVLAAKAR